jgi:RNA polymerase sigma factor (sigma-70 family)
MASLSDDRVYDSYYCDVSKTQMPTSALDEHILFYRYHENGDLEARDRLVRGNLRFVIKTARQFHHGNSEFLKTLIAAGNVGLLHAVERYCQWVIVCPECRVQNYVKRTTRQRCKDCGRRLRKRDAKRFSTRFLTYAYWWIVESIRSELYSSSLVHVPPYKQKEHTKRRRNGERAGPTYIPYDETDTEDRPQGYHSVMQHIASGYTEDEVVNRHAATLLHDLLASLSPRQAYVLTTYYGLREDGKNLREIAATLGICSERVRQIKERGMTELRRKLAHCRVYCTADAYN